MGAIPQPQRELEKELNVALFACTMCSTRLTRAGSLPFLEQVQRVFAAMEQAHDDVKAAVNSFHGQLRMALWGSITHLLRLTIARMVSINSSSACSSLRSPATAA